MKYKQKMDRELLKKRIDTAYHNILADVRSSILRVNRVYFADPLQKPRKRAKC